MTTCDRCSTENLDGSQYCDECGAPLNGPAPAPRNLNGGDPAAGVDGDKKQEASPAQPSPVAQISEYASKKPSPVFAVSSPSVNVVNKPHASLVIERGRSAGKEFPLSDEESQIGRWDADGGVFPDVDLDADDPEAKVSRRHARIMRRNTQYFIEDLGSTNGTFINRGRRLLPGDRQPLRDGDEIIVGKTFLRFRMVK
jgi:pSer/pThr/pTyr-binding forkhead associated (FHA) protein